MNIILAVSIGVLIQQRPAIEIKGLSSEEIAKPIVVDLPMDGFKPSASTYELRSGEISIPMQILEDEQKAVFIVPADVSGNLTFEIYNSDEEGFRLEQDDKTLHVLEGNRPVIDYNFGVMSKEGVPEDRNRSNYFHPVYGLEGEVISDDFPADHYHHRGLYWSWPRVIIGEDDYDLWHLMGIKPHFEAWHYQEAGPVCASLGFQAGWYTSHNNKKVIEEQVEVIIYKSSDIGQAIDFRVEYHAVDKPVTLSKKLSDDKGYGGFLFRPAPRARNNTFLASSTGVEQRDSDLKEFPWADFSATWNGSNVTSGLSIFSNPSNPKFPPGWILRHYGYLGVSWPGLGVHTINPGKPLVLTHRVWIHKGKAEQGKSATAYNVYEKPYASVEFK